MCENCTHWDKAKKREDFDLWFAPCKLKPDKVVTNKVYHGDKLVEEYEMQDYITQSTYSCKSFKEVI